MTEGFQGFQAGRSYQNKILEVLLRGMVAKAATGPGSRDVLNTWQGLGLRVI